MQNYTRTLTLLLAACVLAMTAAPAFAQTGDEAYRTGGENTAGEVQGGGVAVGNDNVADTVSTGSEGSSLPFTGLDVALILAVGGVLVAVGLGTRRLTRHADAA